MWIIDYKDKTLGDCLIMQEQIGGNTDWPGVPQDTAALFIGYNSNSLIRGQHPLSMIARNDLMVSVEKMPEVMMRIWLILDLPAAWLNGKQQQQQQQVIYQFNLWAFKPELAQDFLEIAEQGIIVVGAGPVQSNGKGMTINWYHQIEWVCRSAEELAQLARARLDMSVQWIKV